MIKKLTHYGSGYSADLPDVKDYLGYTDLRYLDSRLEVIAAFVEGIGKVKGASLCCNDIYRLQRYICFAQTKSDTDYRLSGEVPSVFADEDGDLYEDDPGDNDLEPIDFITLVSYVYDGIGEVARNRMIECPSPPVELLTMLQVQHEFYRTIRFITMKHRGFRELLADYYGPDDYSHYNGLHRKNNQLIKRACGTEVNEVRGRRVPPLKDIYRPLCILAFHEYNLKRRPNLNTRLIAMISEIPSNRKQREALEGGTLLSLYRELIPDWDDLEKKSDIEWEPEAGASERFAKMKEENLKDKDRHKTISRVISKTTRKEVDLRTASVLEFQDSVDGLIRDLERYKSLSVGPRGYVEGPMLYNSLMNLKSGLENKAQSLINSVRTDKWLIACGVTAPKIRNIAELVTLVEFNKLCGNTASIYGTTNKQLIFRYPKIIMKDAIGLHWRLGPFRVAVSLKTYEVYVQTWEGELDYEPIGLNNKAHPHNHGGNGKLCTGELQAAIGNAIMERNWLGFYDILSSVMNCYYRHSSIILEGWNNSAHCNPDGSPMDITPTEYYHKVGAAKCPVCGYWEPKEEVWECPDCGKRQHANCTKKCTLDIQDDPRGYTLGHTLACLKPICVSCGDRGDARCKEHVGLDSYMFRQKIMEGWEDELIKKKKEYHDGIKAAQPENLGMGKESRTHVQSATGGFAE